MPFAEIARYVLATAFSGVLAWAALSDIRTRKIPNLSVLAVLALFVPWTLTDMGASTVSQLEAGGIVLALTVALYAFKIFGAGDCKMFAAVALFTGMGYLPYFALATVLAGGVFAIISLATRPQVALAMFHMRGKGDFGPGVPYGAAIALGGIGTIWAMLSQSLPPYAYGQPALGMTSQALTQALGVPGAH